MKRIFLVAALLAAATALVRPGNAAAAQSCNLGNGIKHVVYIQFDNVHFRRDNPNVPSDLEQIPNLLNFLEGNGTVLTNHWTPLISHTSVDITTSLTGVYGDKFGFSDRQQLWPVPERRRRFPQLLHLLDGHVARRHLSDAGARRQKRPSAVGAVYPRGLRCRRLFDRQYRIRKHQQRHQ